MSKANVFIIESLKFSNEKNNEFEGKFLSQILHLGGKNAIYYYVRTKKELKAVLDIFGRSDYRYLHISCHGSHSTLATTLDKIPFPEFGELIRPYLRKKRLFVSACSSVNDDFARAVIPKSGCYSLIGPTKCIYFNDAAIIWASFYHLMFRLNSEAMTRGNILSILRKIENTFGISLGYFSISSKSRNGYKKVWK